jgi:phenylpropionate dioxygenase-like ring-hydroxylating dioxygenase large terminal subunit
MDAKTTRRIKENIAFEAARTKPPAGFPRLPDIAAARYIDPQFLELEKQGLWKRSWLYAGHTSQVAEPGSWLLTRNTGTPILIVRDLQGELRAFYNTCRHRGVRLATGPGNCAKSGFVCPFHGWRFNSAGDNTLIPYSERINKKGCVRSYPTIERNGLVMAWYHPDAAEPQWEIPEIPEFNDPDNFSAMARTVTSGPPPGPKGTTMVIGREGNSWAQRGHAAKEAARNVLMPSKARRTAWGLLMIFPLKGCAAIPARR